YSVEFNGSDQYASIANQSLFNNSGDFTLEAWIKKDSHLSEVAVIDRNAPSDFGLRMLGLREGCVWFHFYTGTTFREVIGATALPNGEWIHIAGVYNGSTAKVYVNGVEDGSVAATGSVSGGGAALTIGRSNRFGRYFDGKIIDVRFWSTDRSAVLAADIDGNESGLIFAYDRDVQPGSGSVFVDKSGNGLDMSLINSPTWSSDVP